MGRSDRAFELVDSNEKMRETVTDLIGIKPDDIRYLTSLSEYIDMVKQERKEGKRA